MNETQLHTLAKETTRNIDAEPTEQTKLTPNSHSNTSTIEPDDDEEEDERLFPKTALEKFFYHLWLLFQTLEHYIHAIVSILLSGYTIYYTNFFYNFFIRVDKLLACFFSQKLTDCGFTRARHTD